MMSGCRDSACGRAKRQRHVGFTLIELSVVLVVIALLLGGLLVALSTQIEVGRQRETEQRLVEVKEAVLGFAAAEDRLPCPARHDTGGKEWSCSGAGPFYGFVPATTLGLVGPRNNQGLLLDGWRSPIRYAVSGGDFVTVGGIRSKFTAGTKPTPDLQVCNRYSSQVPPTSCDSGTEVAVNVPVVFFSLGKDGEDFLSDVNRARDELENAGEFDPPGQSLLGMYIVPGDAVFVMKGLNQNPTDYFDDLVSWISANVLYARLAAANRL